MTMLPGATDGVAAAAVTDAQASLPLPAGTGTLVPAATLPLVFDAPLHLAAEASSSSSGPITLDELTQVVRDLSKAVAGIHHFLVAPPPSPPQQHRLPPPPPSTTAADAALFPYGMQPDSTTVTTAAAAPMPGRLPLHIV